MENRDASKPRGPTSGARHLSWQVGMLANQEATIGARHLSWQAGMLANQEATIGARHLSWQVGMLANMGQKIDARHPSRRDPSDPSYLVWSGANAVGFWPA